jgi:hypothetical protein
MMYLSIVMRHVSLTAQILAHMRIIIHFYFQNVSGCQHGCCAMHASRDGACPWIDFLESGNLEGFVTENQRPLMDVSATRAAEPK